MPENQDKKNNKWLKYLAVIGGIIIVLGLITGGLIYFNLFAAPQMKAEAEQLTVPLGSGDFSELAKLLKDKGFIKNETGFKIAYFKTMKLDVGTVYRTTCVDCYTPGAYKISKSMDAWHIARTIKRQPYMKWVVIPEGLRKEQIADILGDPLSLNWSEKQKSDWVTSFTAMQYDHIEGVYFPDTYLIPINAMGLSAQRLVDKFNEKFAPYSDEALKQNIKWDTLLKIASIIQREGTSKDDMPVISAVIWNRLLVGMKLEIDATVQYARDDIVHYGQVRGDTQPQNYSSAGDWWTPIKPEDIKNIVSPYNTYQNKGLPPHPICNPGLEAIDAALNPAKTDCLYYLHDSDKQIHCAKTYEEHQVNIEQYLR
ncbi:MAG: endolytic transglycosylase MltG [Patescibacteria group bacterium]|jgi:UPF0755 protein